MRLRHFLLTTAILALAASQAAAANYYRGFIGTEPWQLELSIDDNAVRGRLTHDFLPLQLEAGGSFDDEDNSVVARFGLTDGELTGTMLGEPDPFGTFQGTFLSVDGMEPFRFDQVAVYVDYTFSQDLIQATSTYPFFTSMRLQELNNHVQPDLMAEQIQFVQMAQEASVNGDITHGWWFDSRATIEYAAPGLLSSLVTVSDYTGGAHPSLNYWSYNLALVGTRLRPFDLGDLFLADSLWLQELGELVLTDLRDQGADWVMNGTFTEVTERDLQVFVVGPVGLQFVLAPYHVGPWSSGSFTVQIPLDALESLLDPEGPARLLKLEGASAD